MRKQYSQFLIFTLILIALTGVVAATYLLFGHALVKAAYMKEAPEWINRFIAESDVRTVEYFYARADRAMIKAGQTFLVLISAAWLIGAYIFRKKMFIAVMLICISALAWLNLPQKSALNQSVFGEQSEQHLRKIRGILDQSRFFDEDTVKQRLGSARSHVLAHPHKKYNVVIFLEDALRADHVSGYGYQRLTTPFLDRFARSGATFLNAFAPASNTGASCASLMTSLYPSATGAWYLPLDGAYLTLAEIMRSQGFATASFCQNPRAGFYAGLHQGFDHVIEAKENEEWFYQQLYEWIAARKHDRFFLYIHLMDPHSPYDAPQGYRDWYSADCKEAIPDISPLFDPGWVKCATKEGRIALYDGEIRHNDDMLSKLVEKLDEEGALKDTLFIFMSDHGEFLGEYGYWGHHPPLSRDILRVPLVMVYPSRIQKGMRVSDNVAIVDIMPTVLDFAGIDTKDLLLSGESLIPLLSGRLAKSGEDRLIYADEISSRLDKEVASDNTGSLILGQRHIVNSLEFQPFEAKIFRMPFAFLWTKIFNLVHDPHEQRSLDRFFTDFVLKWKAARFILDMKNSNIGIKNNIVKGPPAVAAYDAEVMERLRSLGYAQ